jgi:hypothetical protein
LEGPGEVLSGNLGLREKSWLRQPSAGDRKGKREKGGAGSPLSKGYLSTKTTLAQPGGGVVGLWTRATTTG